MNDCRLFPVSFLRSEEADGLYSGLFEGLSFDDDILNRCCFFIGCNEFNTSAFSDFEASSACERPHSCGRQLIHIAPGSGRFFSVDF